MQWKWVYFVHDLLIKYCSNIFFHWSKYTNLDHSLSAITSVCTRRVEKNKLLGMFCKVYVYTGNCWNLNDISNYTTNKISISIFECYCPFILRNQNSFQILPPWSFRVSALRGIADSTHSTAQNCKSKSIYLVTQLALSDGQVKMGMEDLYLVGGEVF